MLMHYKRISVFGFKDRFNSNVNIKLLIFPLNGVYGMRVQINGKDEELIEDRSLDKKLLADKPFKYTTKCGRKLSIGYLLDAAHLTLKHNGIDVERLPTVK